MPELNASDFFVFFQLVRRVLVVGAVNGGVPLEHGLSVPAVDLHDDSLGNASPSQVPRPGAAADHETTDPRI